MPTIQYSARSARLSVNSGEVQPNAWTPSKRTIKYFQYSAGQSLASSQIINTEKVRSSGTSIHTVHTLFRWVNVVRLAKLSSLESLEPWGSEPPEVRDPGSLDSWTLCSCSRNDAVVPQVSREMVIIASCCRVPTHSSYISFWAFSFSSAPPGAPNGLQLAGSRPLER